MTEPLRIVFAGTPEFAAKHLKALLASPYDIVAVYTQPDRPAGRGQKLMPSAVKQLALEHNIPVLQPPTLRNAEAQAELAALKPDLLVVVAYGLILPQAVLDIPRLGCINSHASLLPRWRGAAPIQRAVEAGDSESGVTVMRMEAGLDTGPMLTFQEETIELTDTADDLLTRLTMQGRELLADTLNSLHEGTAEYTEQDESQATHAAKIHSADARIDWLQPAEVTQRVARAHTPVPGAWTMLGEQRFKIGLLLPTAEEALPAGQMVFHNKKLLVGTGTNVLEIVTLQPPGKKMMQAADWARGQHALQEAPQQFEINQDGTNGHAEGHN